MNRALDFRHLAEPSRPATWRQRRVTTWLSLAALAVAVAVCWRR